MWVATCTIADWFMGPSQCWKKPLQKMIPQQLSDIRWTLTQIWSISKQFPKMLPFSRSKCGLFFTAKLGNYGGHVSHSYIQPKAFLAFILTEQEYLSSSRLWSPGCWVLSVHCHIHVRGGNDACQDPALKVCALWTRSLCWVLQALSEYGH